MKPVTESNELFRGALILTAAALVTKILSAIYRVPFQNIVGDIGFYIYQQVYPFYGALLVLSTYGFPVIISKLYTERQAKGDDAGAARLIVISLMVLSVLGMGLFLLFFLGDDMLASLMGDPRLALLFRVIAVPFLFFPFISVFRGYFQGKGNMMPTAVSQVGEQLVRVITILSLSAVFVHSGYSLYYAGGGAVFGSVTGGAVSVAILSLFFLRTGENAPLQQLEKKSLASDFAGVAKVLAVQGLAVSISGMLLILLQMADSLNMYSLLLSFGLSSDEAKTAKGVFDRGQPLIQLGTVVATSISLSLVPAISAGMLKERKEQTAMHIRLALGTSLLVGAGAAAGLISIIRPVNIMLFENADGSGVLAVLSLAILFGSMTITVNGILQGMGHSLFTAFVITGGFCLKYILNLLFVPFSGTMGAAAATVIAIMAVLAVLAVKLQKLMEKQILLPSIIGKILLASCLMGVFLTVYLRLTNFLYLLADLRLAAAAQSLSAVAFGFFFYLVVVIKGRVLQEEALLAVPFGSRLMFLFPKKGGNDKK
ncbi:polysaccharide biosynthesis protein [Mesobacillus zeae]|uniref:Polysaccharide biosynthesis protein n=1 Tax=Mesobacillus zeae TaxID=1917180 RepID=A0A398BLK7_9BACI|nr:polysaccharide biosynthesis protein [Mesobacillus zeae]RID88650.1 polysaccharide biosynthesis protein [Mesobacillus zeae]